MRLNLIILTITFGLASCDLTNSTGTFTEISRVYSPDSSKYLLTYRYEQGTLEGSRTSFITILNANDTFKQGASIAYSSLYVDSISWIGNNTVIIWKKFTEFVSNNKSNLRDTIQNGIVIKVIQIDPIDSLTHLDADNYGKENKIDFNSLTFPGSLKLSQSMKETIQEKKSEFDRLFEKNKNEYLNYTTDYILDKIDNNADYKYIFVAEYWMAFNYEKMIPELVKRITNKREVGLTNTADLIIWERIESKDLNNYGHGGVANDDLFTVAGRANHLLRRITGENFGSVSMYSTDRDLKKIQNRWAFWIINLKK